MNSLLFTLYNNWNFLPSYYNIKNNKYSHQHGAISFENIDFEGFDFTGLNLRGFSFIDAENVNSTITKANTDNAIFYMKEQIIGREEERECHFDEETFNTDEEQIWLIKKQGKIVSKSDFGEYGYLL